MNYKILVADDDPILRRLMSDIIKKQNYQPILAQNGQEAIDLFFKNTDVSLCILDVMMPIYTGYEVLETIREHSDLPVIVLTAMGDENSEIEGFNKGADDYIAKPFSYPVLLARIERLLNKERKTQEQIYENGEIKVDFKGHRVFISKEEIILNNKEFAMLSYLIINQAQVLSREQLLDKIWGYDYDGEIRTVDTHVKMLRKKMKNYGKYIVTVRGTGYKFQVAE